jgi:SAM-dependent methyltransferase
VIEHLQRPREFVSECTRVLRPGGVLILSTPNRLTFSPEGIRNPFHTVEFSPGELRTLLETKLVVERVAGTFHGPRIALRERLTRSSFPERLIATPVPEWPGWVRRTVARVTPEDFRIRDGRVERALDLVAVARR